MARGLCAGRGQSDLLRSVSHHNFLHLDLSQPSWRSVPCVSQQGHNFVSTNKEQLRFLPPTCSYKFPCPKAVQPLLRRHLITPRFEMIGYDSSGSNYATEMELTKPKHEGLARLNLHFDNWAVDDIATRRRPGAATCCCPLSLMFFVRTVMTLLLLLVISPLFFSS